MPEEVKTEEASPEIFLTSDKSADLCLQELKGMESRIAEHHAFIKWAQESAQRRRDALERWMCQLNEQDPDKLTAQYPTGVIRLRQKGDRIDLVIGYNLADYASSPLVKTSYALDKKAAKLAIDNNEAPAFVTVIPGEGHSFSYQFNVEAAEDCAKVAKEIATDAAQSIANPEQES